jgi:hypothetical protein
MTLQEFAKRIPNLGALPHREKIKRFAWWLHTHGKRERFDVAAIRNCYSTLSLEPSANLSVELSRMVERKPRELLKDSNGYRLEARVKEALDAQYGEHETVLVVSQLLKDLPGRVSDVAEQRYLSEALTCYKHQAFRAATVMTWNLAYDHLLGWILADAQRLADFNAAIPKAYPQDKKKVGLVITKRMEFNELKEFDVIAVCAKGSLISDDLKKVLNEKLVRRNIAAHPSLVEITRAQADDTITDLVNNVVLALT